MSLDSLDIIVNSIIYRGSSDKVKKIHELLAEMEIVKPNTCVPVDCEGKIWTPHPPRNQ